jgi:hypothetical protein
MAIPKTSRAGLLALLFLCACTDRSEERAGKQTSRSNLEFGFETTLEDWVALGGSGERAFDRDIVITREEAYSGEACVRFTVSAESVVARGTRAELTYDDQAGPGEERWYAWRILIPTGHPDVPMDDADGEPNWQLMGQWHQQPVVVDGEDWDNFTGKGESPPLALNYLRFRQDDPNFQRWRRDPRLLNVPGFDPDWNGVSVFMLTYGTPPVPVAVRPVSKGTWHEVVVRVRWARDDSGLVQAWLDGVDMADGPVRGPNMWNRASHYFKFGLYRNPDIPQTVSVYYDDIRIGATEADAE